MIEVLSLPLITQRYFKNVFVPNLNSLHIEEENIKARSRDVKRVTTSDSEFSHSASDGHGHFMF